MRIGPGRTNRGVVCDDTGPDCAEWEEEGYDCRGQGAELRDASIELEG
jgi:hypothetical protein